jgi:hypothetical protein
VGGWRTLHDELQNIYASQNIITVIKTKKMRWVENIARMREMRNAYSSLVGKPK